MYFSRIELRREGSGVARLLRTMEADDYRHHQFVWQLFSGEAERSFIYRREDVGAWPRYYVVSEQPPEDREGLWQVETKAYEPRLKKGERLAFSLRVNPVVSRKDAGGKGRRHDVVMDAKRQIGFKDMPPEQRTPLPQIVREAGLRWLESRMAKNGFVTERDLTTVDGYQQHRAVKRGAKSLIRFSTLEFSGLVTVTEPELFLQALFKGIGPAKALGCGLLMVRRA